MTWQTGEIFRAHRLILARNSEFFARILMSDFKEKKEARIKLNFADPGQTLTQISPSDISRSISHRKRIPFDPPLSVWCPHRNHQPKRHCAVGDGRPLPHSAAEVMERGEVLKKKRYVLLRKRREVERVDQLKKNLWLESV